MEIHGWRYYNHAAMPSTPPHREADLTPIRDGSIWKMDGSPLLARWTTDWDCGQETSWWYVIKDTPFDIESLKAKRRYEITKGKRNFTVRKIRALDYGERLYEITVEAFNGWPEKTRPKTDRDAFLSSLESWDDHLVYGAFSNETGVLYGFAYLSVYETYTDFQMLRTVPACEKEGINTAVVAGILEDYREKLEHGHYILDGSRAINHETAFQDYLEKYFGFRKAYGKLCIAYRPGIACLVRLLYPMRGLLKRFDDVGLLHKANAILKMEEIRREEEP